MARSSRSRTKAQKQRKVEVEVEEENEEEEETEDAEEEEEKLVATGEERTGRWSDAEHEAFLDGLEKYGREWKKVAGRVGTRTVMQTRTHAQKYFGTANIEEEAASAKDNKDHSNKTSVAASAAPSTEAALKSRRTTRSTTVAPPEKDKELPAAKGRSRHRGAKESEPKKSKDDSPDDGEEEEEEDANDGEVEKGDEGEKEKQQQHVDENDAGKECAEGGNDKEEKATSELKGDPPTEPNEDNQDNHKQHASGTDEKTVAGPTEIVEKNGADGHTPAATPSIPSSMAPVLPPGTLPVPGAANAPSDDDILLPMNETTAARVANREYVELLKANCVIFHSLASPEQFWFARNICHFMTSVRGRRWAVYNHWYGYQRVPEPIMLVAQEFRLDPLKRAALQFHPFWLLGEHDPGNVHGGAPFIHRKVDGSWKPATMSDVKEILKAEGSKNLLLLPAGIKFPGDTTPAPPTPLKEPEDGKGPEPESPDKKRDYNEAFSAAV